MLCGSLPSRSLSIVALVALLLAAAPFPGAEAQFGIGSAPRETPLLPDALAPVEVLSDPAGDTELLGNMPIAPGVDSDENDYEATADILSLTVSENQDFLVFGLKHRAYPETSATASNLVLFQDLECSIEFHINGDETRYYEATLDGEQFLDGSDYRAWGWLYERRQSGDDEDYFERDTVGLPWVEMIGYDHFEILIEKEVLEADQRGRSLRIGDDLTDMYVECTRAVTLLVEYYDEAGGADAPSVPYELTAATRSGELEIAFPEAEDGQSSALTVAPEGATKLSVVIKNLRDRKLLVNVTATLVDASGQSLKDWKVQAAPTFELKANASLPASLIITPPENVQHRDGGYLTVRAIPLGFDDHVQVTRWVSAVVSPSPEHNVLFFHDTPWESYSCAFICTGNDDDPQLAHGSDQFVMNTLQVDPRLGETDTANEGITMFSSDRTYVYLDAPLGDTIRFDPEGMFELTMSMRSDVERELVIDGYLWAGDEVVGAFDTTVTVGSAFSTHTVEFMPNLDHLVAPAGSWLGVEIYIREGGSISFTGSTWMDSVDWRPAESSLTLPLVALPKKVANITDGRALPTLALSNQTDAEEYVNPGDTQAFDLLLVNEGREKDVVGLKADLPTGWHVSFYPGDQFDLEPGSSAPVCVSITAPDDAVDSDRAHVNLTAWSRSDPDVRTTTQLLLTVVTNIEIDEEICPESDDYVKPFTERERGTPGVSAPALIGLLALLGVALRRRP